MVVLESERPPENGTTATTDNGMPYQVVLHAAPPTNAAWFAFCRANVISMGAAHVLAREVERSGSATLGTYPNKDAAEEICRILRKEVGIGGEGKEEEEGVTCVPAPGGGGGDAEPDRKKAKVTASDGTRAANAGDESSSADNNKKAAEDEAEKKRGVVVHPEIRRLYDEGTITQGEYERMAAADRRFESEVAAAPATFAVAKWDASAEQRFEYNHGRRPDVYDAYAHRHDRRFWVNGRLYEANVRTLDAVCLVEFCRKVSFVCSEHSGCFFLLWCFTVQCYILPYSLAYPHLANSGMPQLAYAVHDPQEGRLGGQDQVPPPRRHHQEAAVPPGVQLRPGPRGRAGLRPVLPLRAGAVPSVGRRALWAGRSGRKR